MTDEPGFRPETHSTVESLLAPEVAEALAILRGYIEELDLPEERTALALITRELERGARVEAAARAIRQWDMLNTYIGGDELPHEPTADAPYWRDRLDAALASQEEGR